MKNSNFCKDALFGLATGDALGVPVEFKSRFELGKNPVTGMREYGTHRQPAGTWSDDSSMAFCLAETLVNGYNLAEIGKSFVAWFKNALWTPHGDVFDIGVTTHQAICELARGTEPQLAGPADERSNGNGALMRILPLLFYVQNQNITQRFLITKDVASITHGHIRSVICCFYYLEYARLIVNGTNAFEAYHELKTAISGFLNQIPVPEYEMQLFNRLLVKNIYEFPEKDIASGGYVLHTLEAALWCILTSKSYSETVLKAVNLGDDTDTTAAVAGGLAGLIYGFGAIPAEWIAALARKNDIELLAEKLWQTNGVMPESKK